MRMGEKERKRATPLRTAQTTRTPDWHDASKGTVRERSPEPQTGRLRVEWSASVWARARGRTHVARDRLSMHIAIMLCSVRMLINTRQHQHTLRAFFLSLTHVRTHFFWLLALGCKWVCVLYHDFSFYHRRFFSEPSIERLSGLRASEGRFAAVAVSGGLNLFSLLLWEGVLSFPLASSYLHVCSPRGSSLFLLLFLVCFQQPTCKTFQERGARIRCICPFLLWSVFLFSFFALYIYRFVFLRLVYVCVCLFPFFRNFCLFWFIFTINCSFCVKFIDLHVELIFALILKYSICTWISLILIIHYSLIKC